MLINRTGRRERGCQIVERPPVRIVQGRPVASLLVHDEGGQDVELAVWDLAEATALVSAVIAMQAELVIAVEANAGGMA